LSVVIRTTLGALVEAESVLTELATIRLPARSAYHLKKLAAMVTSETAHFHAERNAIIAELGTPRTDGGFEIAPGSPVFRTFVTRVTEVAAIDVEVHWGPLTLAMLGDVPITAQQLASLGPLFEDDTEVIG
jgi:hypothetical protein